MTSIVEHVSEPVALLEYKRRELPGGALLEFEERRDTNYRAYYYTPQPKCPDCGGSGRVPSSKRANGTVKCQPCKGSGECKRERFISVTTLLDAILPKPGLPIWAEARGIEGVIAAMRLGEIDHGTDPADAVKIVRALKLGADAARDKAADRGLNVHALLEAYMRTGDPPRIGDHPVEHHGYVAGLCRWLLEKNPEPEAVEELVCDPVARYAGRSDLVARVGGFRVRYDAKTQERCGIYAGAHLQVKLYERGSIACGDEPCDFLRAVVFAADGEYDEMECEATDATVDAALEFAGLIRPIDSLCEQRNRRERQARNGASPVTESGESQ